MSFSISEAKVEELLKSEGAWNGGATPSGSNVVTENNTSFYPSYPVGGTTYAIMTLVTPYTGDKFTELRKRIEVAGVSLISTDELESEIRDMRR